MTKADHPPKAAIWLPYLDRRIHKPCGVTG